MPAEDARPHASGPAGDERPTGRSVAPTRRSVLTRPVAAVFGVMLVALTVWGITLVFERGPLSASSPGEVVLRVLRLAGIDGLDLMTRILHRSPKTPVPTRT